MRRELGLALLAASLACASTPASAYTTLFAFGDSLSDAGNDYIGSDGAIPVSPPYYQGHFSNGPTWVEDLSVKLGLGKLTPSLAGGDDFAFGGAQTGSTDINPDNPLPIDLPAQIADYKSEHPKPVSGALYTLDIGANDILNALDDYGSGTIKLDKVRAVVKQAEGNTVDAVEDLYDLGARSLLFYEVPNLGLTPALRHTALQSLGSELALSFDTTVVDDLKPLERDGLKVYDLNTYALLTEIVDNPAAYGFTHVSKPCWTGSFTSASSGKLCSPVLTVQNQYLFWDSEHPTAAADRLAADFAYDALTAAPESSLMAAPEPSTWAMMLIGFAGLSLAGWRARNLRAVKAS
jgi:phospholipase/lecithinase/hemolysin